MQVFALYLKLMFILNANQETVNRELKLKLLLLNMESSQSSDQVIVREYDER